MAFEDVHGRLLLSFDVRFPVAFHIFFDGAGLETFCLMKELTMAQCWLDQHASPNPHRIRFDCCHLYCYPLLHSLRLPPDAQKLANLSRPWK